MRSRSVFTVFLLILGVLLLIPVEAIAQSEQPATGKPPIAQPLVREGDFAVKLVDALKLGTITSETEAESKLGDAGIAPRNGWIADYPVTPDIIGELRQSISDAAGSDRLTMGKDEALLAFQDVATGLTLGIKAGAPPAQVSQKSPSYDSSGSNTVVNNYYGDQGPPIVTYYSPPPAYFYLYTWVPYPFWWWNVWCPGYFILSDFHKVIHVHHGVVIISNHFVDYRANRVFRIDPVRRFNGRTYGGIGVPRASKRFIITGTRGGGNGAVFRGSHERELSEGNRTVTPSSGGGKDGGSWRGSGGGGGGRSERK
jgi:hypothetical protein